MTRPAGNYYQGIAQNHNQYEYRVARDGHRRHCVTAIHVDRERIIFGLDNVISPLVLAVMQTELFAELAQGLCFGAPPHEFRVYRIAFQFTSRLLGYSRFDFI